MIKQVFWLFLNGLLFVLSWLVPKKQGLILLGSGLGENFSGNPKYLFLYLHGLSSKPFDQYFWITKNYYVLKDLENRNMPVLNSFTMNGFWNILRSEYLIIESGPADKKGGHDIAYQRIFLGRFKIVQTWHGSPVKRILLDALKDRSSRRWFERLYFYFERLELKNFWCILAMGVRERNILKDAFSNPNVKIFGYPKNDMLSSGNDKEFTQSTFTKYNKVILYAPTFRENNQALPAFSRSFVNKINFEMKKRNWIFLVKKHPYDKQLNISPWLSNVHDVSERYHDIQELLVCANVLITDYSSVYVDYMLTKKAIIFYVYDILEYQEKSRGLYYDFLADAPGPVIHTQEDLLEYILKDVDETHINYEKTLDIFHVYKDNKSSQRLVEYLINNR